MLTIFMIEPPHLLHKSNLPYLLTLPSYPFGYDHNVLQKKYPFLPNEATELINHTNYMFTILPDRTHILTYLTLHTFLPIDLPNYLLPQPNQQNKTKQLGWCGIIIGKKNTTPHHTGCDYILIHFQATHEADCWYVTLF